MDEREKRPEEPIAPADDAVSDEGREEVEEERQSAFAPSGRPDHARPAGEPPPPEG